MFCGFPTCFKFHLPPALVNPLVVPGDLYYFHKMMHATHDLAIKTMCALGDVRPRLERFLFRVNFILLLLLVVSCTQESAHKNDVRRTNSRTKGRKPTFFDVF